jgi:putative N6-adenine-specific DNA methylase
MGEFAATTFDELFEGTKALPWQDWIPVDGEFPVFLTIP